MSRFKHAGESSTSSKLICKQTSCCFYGLILVNNGTYRKMSIIELKISINSHCANIDPKIFFICALRTFLDSFIILLVGGSGVWYRERDGGGNQCWLVIDLTSTPWILINPHGCFRAQSSGLGGLEPNTLMINWPENWRETEQWGSFVRKWRRDMTVLTHTLKDLFTWRWGTPDRWGKMWRLTPPVM